MLTRFTITCLEPKRLYSFDMENDNLSGKWTGYFSRTDAGTKVEFVEMIAVKKWWHYPFAAMYLKKQQRRYIADLKRRCEKREA